HPSAKAGTTWATLLFHNSPGSRRGFVIASVRPIVVTTLFASACHLGLPVRSSEHFVCAIRQPCRHGSFARDQLPRTHRCCRTRACRRRRASRRLVREEIETLLL